MSTNNNKSGSQWKYISLKDDDGNEIQRFELNEKQKLTTFKIRNKKRKLKNKATPTISVSGINQDGSPKLSLGLNFHQEIIFSRERGILPENSFQEQPMMDDLSYFNIEQRMEPSGEILLLDDSILGQSYCQSIDNNATDTESLYFTGFDEIGDVFCI